MLKAVWEWLRGVVLDLVQNQYSEAFLKALGLDPASFWQNLAVSVAAGFIVPVVTAVGGSKARRRLRLMWRAATIRKAADAAFVIVYCPIADDKDETIERAIRSRLLAHFKAFAGVSGDKKYPFEVISFPLALAADKDNRGYRRSVGRAKYWLKRTNGDVLIWGARSITEYDGIIRFVGKNTEGEIIEPREIHFNTRAADFDEALAISIAYEIARLTQRTLSSPEGAALQELRRVSEKIERVLASNASSITTEMRSGMAKDQGRILLEIVRNSNDPIEQTSEQLRAENGMAEVDPSVDGDRFANAALRYGTLVRRRNWVDPDVPSLEYAQTKLAQAVPLFEAAGDALHAGHAMIEQLHLRGLECLFIATESLDEKFSRMFDAACRVIIPSGNIGLIERLRAISTIYLNVIPVGGIENLDDAAGPLTMLERMVPHLDIQEILAASPALATRALLSGDSSSDPKKWLAAFGVFDALVGLTGRMSADEQLIYHAYLAESLSFVSQRLQIKKEIDPDGFKSFKAPDPSYLQMRSRSAAAIVSAHIERIKGEELNRLHVLAMDCISYELIRLKQMQGDEAGLKRMLDLLRRGAHETEVRFLSYRRRHLANMASTLNSFAANVSSLSAAMEAKQIVERLLAEKSAKNILHLVYVDAFSSRLVAKYTAKEDVELRESRARAAFRAIENTLTMAAESENSHYMQNALRLFRQLEEDFPHLRPAQLDTAGEFTATKS